MKPTAEVERITPEIAKRYLATNPDKQRNVTHALVVHYCSQMEKGQWMVNGEGIIFDNEGVMIEGQHRMMAVIMSGIAVDFLVIRGIRNDAFHTINTGKPRTIGNVFAIDGVKNFNVVAAATSGVLNYRRAIAGNSGRGGSLIAGARRPSRTDCLEEYRKFPQQYEAAVHIAMGCKKTIAQSVSSVVAAAAMIDAGHDEEKVSYFWELVRTGIGLSENDPILLFRQRLAQNDRSKSKLSGVLLTMLSIKAWNLYVASKSAAIIRLVEGEPCPVIK